MSKTLAPPDYENLVIRASAGTGKTFQLSNRYLGLLSAGVTPQRMLAVTFTRKAAGEILDRILVRLARAAASEDECGRLAGFVGDPTLNRARCMELLTQLTGNLHRLRISTLDSFFAQVARSFSLDLGLPLGWQIVPVLDEQELQVEAIQATLQHNSSSELNRLINLLAKGEAERSVAQLLQSTVDGLYEVFQETKAEAWHRICRPRLLSGQQREKALGELTALPLPANKHFVHARDADVASFRDENWEGFLDKGLAGAVCKKSQYYKKPIDPPIVAVYQKLIDHARAALSRQVADQTEATYRLLEKFDEQFGRLKRQRRAMRFGDVTRRLAAALRTDDFGLQPLAFRLDGQISHLLLDEFQDTSLGQWQVIRHFAERVTGGSDGESFFCVGDVKQAIYGWRGGVAEIFDAIQGQLSGLTSWPLDTSYRSAPPIIETVNRLFTGLKNHSGLDKLEAGVQRWCNRFKEHTTAKGGQPGYACLVTAPWASDGQTQYDATLCFAAERIDKIVRRAPGHNVGVLARTNETVAKLIFQLGRLGVPASQEGGNPLTDSAAVQAVLSLVRLADHPGDTIARFHVAHCPLGGLVGLTDDRDDEAAGRLAGKVRRWLLTDGYGPTVYHWACGLAPSCDRRDLNRLLKLVQLAYDYPSSAALRADRFAAYVENGRVADPTTDPVRVMTVHQAKGLEFPIVVLPDLDGKLVGQREAYVTGRPGPAEPVDRVCVYRNETIQRNLSDDVRRMFDDAQHRAVAHALSVFYVAVTRAASALHMIVAPSVKKPTKLPKTPAGLLRAGLTDMGVAAPETTLYECGDPRWYGHPAAENAKLPAAEPAAVAEAEPLAVRLAPARARSRGLERASPSGLEGGSRVKLDDLFRLDNAEALYRGTLVHAWFEQIAWLEDSRPDEVVLRRVAGAIPGPALDIDKLIGQFNTMLGAPQIAAALSRDAYSPPTNLTFSAAAVEQLAAGPFDVQVCHERRLAVRDGDTIVTGSVDRLVLMRQDTKIVAADIIDFKTDAVSADDKRSLDEKIAFYRPQLEAYRRAVAKMTGLDAERISARLLFVTAGMARTV